MRVDGIDALPAGIAIVTTVGVFDGVHRGHAAVVDALVACARAEGAVPVAITFDPHPRAVLTGRPPDLLCSVAERVRLLAALGVALVVVEPFTDALRALSADAFIDRVAAGRTLRGLVMSPESAFGHDRAGTRDAMAARAAREGWRLVDAPLVEEAGERISSERIRRLLDAGDLAAAARLLGRSVA